MNIEWVIPCRFVEVHDNLATIIGGGIDNFWLPNEPRIVQAMFALRLTAMPEELAGQPHRLVNEIRSPSDEVINRAEAELGAQVDEVLNPEWLQGLTLAGGVQFQANEPGTYTVTHRVDDSEHSLPFHIHHNVPAGTQPPG